MHAKPHVGLSQRWTIVDADGRILQTASAHWICVRNT